jgi:cellobiose phosphorylase
MYGWDGEWYWRASKDNNELIGSHLNEEGKIFLNAQIWSAIADTADLARQKQVMAAVEKYLETNVGPILLAPAYKKSDMYIGYLSRYAPGVRENGGVYTHAATWAIWAATLLKDVKMAYRFYQKICPIYNGNNPDVYKAEPYVTPGNIDGPDSIHYGKGGWTWYTGSAAWLFRVTVDFFLGIQADYDGLIVKPCYPKTWEQVSIQRLFRGAYYRITIKNNSAEQEQPIEIYINNHKISGEKIPVINDKKVIEILVKRKI